MLLKCFAPKKFLCYFSLKLGAIFVGVFMSCIAMITCIVLLVQAMKMDVNSCQKFVWRSALSFNVIAIIYHVIIFIMNLALIWAVYNNRRILLLFWVIVTDVWLVQTFLLLIVLLCIYSTEVSLASWIMSIIFGFIAIGVLAYLSMVVYGYWLELNFGAIEPAARNAPNNL